MSAARADRRQRSRKKKFIAALTLTLLLLLVSLLGGLSSQMSPSATGFLATTPAAQPGTPAPPVTARRPRPRPMAALPGPTLTPAEEILMEIARYAGSATAANQEKVPLAGDDRLPRSAPAAPPPGNDETADFHWPRRPHKSLLLPRQLAGDCGDRPCGGTAAPCPGNPWLLIPRGGPVPEESRLSGPDSSLIPGGGDGRGGETSPPVPEPATLFLLGSGLACLAGLGRWRKRPA